MSDKIIGACGAMVPQCDGNCPQCWGYVAEAMAMDDDLSDLEIHMRDEVYPGLVSR